LADRYRNLPPPRGEIVIVIGPPPDEAAPQAQDLDAMLRGALTRASVKDAVAEIASATGLGRGEVYKRALAIVDEQDR
jgi:16S rRNA (cytidine1402-2'-O)-methyltransferase